ncbi:Helicase conserved C-terminal domain-containing protein [Pseudomonas reinekei]|uniref:Helicase n=1 Tax=Pseudomonas reinekei TaxID=395598 RepID=A0A1H0QZ11_PSERE|nr:DEAD/DEAH box helicase [Pseudomonas reinekei]KAB0481177.1 helicase [Pseudomonas reinekei]OLT99469.1 hypothetical protein BVK86_25625 [Pseudomonas reinekei]SDP22457.1 Helicase conserved C-terminal domain-containing protein [Pseudomonas reinekei]
MSSTSYLPGSAHHQLAATLSSLKDFQRATVDRIIGLFKNPEHSQRILVADEVGLGKTIVAKGVVASLLMEWHESRPFRVTYICSNLALASENRTKLAVFKKNSQARFVREPAYSRLAEVALLPEASATDDALLEFCTLTPSTSFSMTYGAGNRRERLIIFAALLKDPEIGPLQDQLSDLFRERVQDVNGWVSDLKAIKARTLDVQVVADFHRKLRSTKVPCERSMLEVLQHIAQFGVDRDRSEERGILREIRLVFAHCCAAQLKADLFILDEFQRFDSLLDQSDENEHSLIAQQVFRNRRRDKILLLSATPFKAMSTINDDENDDGHLIKLQQILRFLNLTPLTTYEPARKSLQSELMRLRQPGIKVDQLSSEPRHALEELLRPLICRTERSQIAGKGDGLTADFEIDCTAEVSPDDVRAYIELDQLSKQLEQKAQIRVSGQMMDFFKSAAWPLSFSTGYKLQEVLQRCYQAENRDVYRQVRRSKTLWLPRERVASYQLNVALEAPNPSFRALTKHLFTSTRKNGPEMLLWVPPTRPHYPLAGFYSGHENFTKTLVFSAWAMVPRMMSGLLSYEAERRALGKRAAKLEYFPTRGRGDDYTRTSQHQETHRLFRLESCDLAIWSLLYPSKMLAKLPLDVGGASLESLIASRITHFKSLLAPLGAGHAGTRNQNHWYLLAPMLLDQCHFSGWCEAWLASEEIAPERAEEIQKRLNNTNLLGVMPDDLPEYLAWLSVGSPAVCAYRALLVSGRESDGHQQQATQVAHSFMTLFNTLNGSAAIRRMPDRQHWWSMVRYCAEGGLQAVLEEYFYMLAPEGNAEKVVEAVSNVLHTRASSVKVWKAGDKTDHTHLRCHYAVQLGTQSISDSKGQERVVSIRESFNSPFRPFVLTSTSIGQEGLDFHWYCSDIVHWNLPGNPIDLEQREGRVNRYQSLVVRRRVAQALADHPEAPQGWHALFETAAGQDRSTDLVPYWHYPTGDAKIRRLVPMLALSHEHQRYPQMLKILSLYRLAFGQPGQSELVAYLNGLNLSEGELDELKQRLMIQLAPVLYGGGGQSGEYQQASYSQEPIYAV